jgi:hypothetical protein
VTRFALGGVVFGGAIPQRGEATLGPC